MLRKQTLFVALAVVAFGYSPVAAQLELGAKGGITFSKASVENAGDIDLSYLTSFGGGAFLRIPLGRLGLQPEVLWVSKGAKVEGDDLDGSVDLTLDYVEIPVLLTLPFGTGESLSPYIFGGGSFAFEAGCTFGIDGGGISADVDCDDNSEDLEIERKSSDISAIVGAGLRIPAGSVSLLLEGRYTLGLTDLNDSGDSDDGLKHRTIAVYAGVSFPIGR